MIPSLTKGGGLLGMVIKKNKAAIGRGIEGKKRERSNMNLKSFTTFQHSTVAAAGKKKV